MLSSSSSSPHNTSFPCGGLAQHHIPAHTYMHHVPISKACVRTTHMARNFPWQHFTCGWKKFKVGNQEKKPFLWFVPETNLEGELFYGRIFRQQSRGPSCRRRREKYFSHSLKQASGENWLFHPSYTQEKEQSLRLKNQEKNGGREKMFMAGIRGDGGGGAFGRRNCLSSFSSPPSSMISIFPSAKRRRSKHDDPGRLA